MKFWPTGSGHGSTTGGVFRSGMCYSRGVRPPDKAFTDVGQRPAIVMPLRSEHTVLGVMVVPATVDRPLLKPKMSTS